MIRSASCAVASLLLMGCLPVPIPHVHQQTPEIHGRIHRAGEPIAALSVERTVEWSSETATDSTRTNSNGSFDFPGRSAFHPGALIWPIGLPHYIYRWELCFHAPDAQQICWSDFSYSPGDAPKSLTVDCDLDRLRDLDPPGSAHLSLEEPRANAVCGYAQPQSAAQEGVEPDVE